MGGLKLNNQGSIEIVVTTDRHYIQHLGVMLCSLFENNPQQFFIIHVLFDFHKNANTRKLERQLSKSGHILHWYPVPKDWGSALKVNGHVTRSTYFRLLIPDLLSKDVTKVLYLDSDMLIQCSIISLWKTELAHFSMAAVPDNDFSKHGSLLGMHPEQLYFNAGVLLINLPVWRENKVSEKAMTFALKHPEKIEFWDQDALNVVLAGRWLALPQHWNQTSSLFKEYDQSQLHLLPLGIVHFTGSSKPWQYLNTHPLKHEYYRYLQLTPWKGFRHPEESVWHRFKQSIKKALNHFHGYEKYPLYN